MIPQRRARLTAPPTVPPVMAPTFLDELVDVGVVDADGDGAEEGEGAGVQMVVMLEEAIC